MGHQYQFQYAIEEGLALIPGLLSMIPSGAIHIAAYVLSALALYTMAKRRGITHPWLSWVPVVGVLLETAALWKTEEKHIRWLSLAALPFWLFYNLGCGAYGAALGNVLAAGSIITAIVRFDFPHKKTAQNFLRSLIILLSYFQAKVTRP